MILSPPDMLHVLQVNLRPQALIYAKYLAKSQEMQQPRLDWEWWRPGSRTTAAPLAGSLK